MQTKRHLYILAAMASAAFLWIATVPWLSVNAQSGQSESEQNVGKPVGQLSVPGYGNTNAKPLPKGGPPPHTRDGHVDFSGVWFAGQMGVDDVTRGQFAAFVMDTKFQTAAEKTGKSSWPVKPL